MNAARALTIAISASLLACGSGDTTHDGGSSDAGTAIVDAATLDAARADSSAGDAATPPDGGGIPPCVEPPAGAPSYEEHRGAARAAGCAAEERCGGALAPWLSLATTCHPGFAGDTAFLAELVDDGSVCFDATAASDCIAAYERGDCSELAWSVLGTCRRVLRPMLAAGEACVAHEQCFEGRCRFDAECPGTCVSLPTEGELCTDLLDCATGLLCNGGTCRPPHAAGEPCDSVLSCEAGLACIVGECRERLGSGERCAPLDCEASLYCYRSGDVSACRERGIAGADCNADEECSLGLVCSLGACRDAAGPGDACAGDETCPRAFDCDVVAGCVPLPRFGEACDARGCWEGDCVGGTCTGRGAGVSCGEDRDCAGYCDIDLVFGNECVDPLPEGAACERARECARGLECREGACRTACSR